MITEDSYPSQHDVE